ncbi:MAG TPA: hypothetical protein VLI90_00070, partial [Tepidisphaeraceae bacterium]|nr:hypothetical protein [Tepidisphaeraceae bacterium]
MGTSKFEKTVSSSRAGGTPPESKNLAEKYVKDRSRERIAPPPPLAASQTDKPRSLICEAASG